MAKFPLGQVVITPGALQALAEAEQAPGEFLDRHANGDWGDLGEDDKAENEFSLPRHLRIFSAYHTAKGRKLWIITGADRSSTCLLLPSEY